MLINAWLSGAITIAALTIALFFLRYWRHSGERLFLYFALAFVLEGVHRLLPALPNANLDSPEVYLIRLVEYLLILFAIIAKNRKSNGRGSG